MPELCLAELKTNSKLAHSLLVTEGKPTVGDVMSCEDFSSLQRLLRVTAYILRAVNHFKAKGKPDPILPITLTPQEIAAAEKLWITHAQKDLVVQKDFDALRCQFGLFFDDKGLWRCGSWLQNADIPFAAKHPVLLPRKHPLTALIACNAHLHVDHNGVKETLTELRQRYWVVRGRSLIRAIIHRCTTCKKHEGAPIVGPPPHLCQNSESRKTLLSLIRAWILQAPCLFEIGPPVAAEKYGSVYLLAWSPEPSIWTLYLTYLPQRSYGV